MSDTSFESVIDYLSSLAWDGTPRLDRWLVECAGADDSPYVRAVSRAMLVAAVRRARHPGCRFDRMPVLEGPQGCGKSAALRVLAIADAWLLDHASAITVDVPERCRLDAGTDTRCPGCGESSPDHCGIVD